MAEHRYEGNDYCCQCGALRHVVPGGPPSSLSCTRARSSKSARRRRQKSNHNQKAKTGSDQREGIIDPKLRREIDEAQAPAAYWHRKPAGIPTKAERARQSLNARLDDIAEDDAFIGALRFGDLAESGACKRLERLELNERMELGGMTMGMVQMAMMTPKQTEILKRTPIRGNLHRQCFRYVFKNDETATWKFYSELSKATAAEKVALKREFSDQHVHGYTARGLYSVLTYLYDAVGKHNRVEYHELCVLVEGMRA